MLPTREPTQMEDWGVLKTIFLSKGPFPERQVPLEGNQSTFALETSKRGDQGWRGFGGNLCVFLVAAA